MILLKIIVVILGAVLSVKSMTADPAYYSQPPPHATTYDGQPLPRRPYPRRNILGTHLPLRQDFSRRQDNFNDRHLDNYQMRQQNNYPLNHQDSYPLNHQDSYPLNHQDNFPLNHQDNFPLNHQDNFPLNHQDNFPINNQDTFPMRQQDNFPLRPEGNFPNQQESFPLRQQDNFVTRRPFINADLDRTGRQMRYRNDVQEGIRDRTGYYPNRDQQRDYPVYNDRDGSNGYAPNYQDSRRGVDGPYSGPQRFPLERGPLGDGGRSSPMGYGMHLKR